MIIDDLFAMQDLKYKDFNKNLIPNQDTDFMIGIRTPELRKYAKDLSKKKGECEEFISKLPHKYYEENCLHAFLLETVRDYDLVIYELDRFLPYINNWATCDSMKIKVLSKNKDKLVSKIKEWISSNHTYTIRYSIGLLMSLYLDEDFSVEYTDMVANVESDEYYVNMMRAWYFATALAKQYDSVVPYIEEHRLDEWTNNKSIQKSIESNRISNDQKEYLRTLKIKK